MQKNYIVRFYTKNPKKISIWKERNNEIQPGHTDSNNAAQCTLQYAISISKGAKHQRGDNEALAGTEGPFPEKLITNCHERGANKALIAKKYIFILHSITFS